VDEGEAHQIKLAIGWLEAAQSDSFTRTSWPVISRPSSSQNMPARYLLGQRNAPDRHAQMKSSGSSLSPFQHGGKQQ